MRGRSGRRPLGQVPANGKRVTVGRARFGHGQREEECGCKGDCGQRNKAHVEASRLDDKTSQQVTQPGTYAGRRGEGALSEVEPPCPPGPARTLGGLGNLGCLRPDRFICIPFSVLLYSRRRTENNRWQTAGMFPWTRS